jgi:hypothetical protein
MDLAMTKRAAVAIAGLGAALAALVLAVVVVQWPRAPGPTSTPPPIIQPGDDAFASGTVVVDDHGQARVCRPGGGLDDTGPMCLPVEVHLSGLTPAQTEAWTTSGNEKYTTNVTVHGTWTGASVAVRSITAGAIPDPADASPDNPCPAIPGRPQAQDSNDFDAALHRLNDLIEQHPADYGGMWAATASDGGPVIVAAVVRNKPSAEIAVHTAFPYPVCVVSVQNSTSDLQSTFARLQAIDGTGNYEIDAPKNSVRIDVPVLDGATWARYQVLGGAVAIVPLVRMESAQLRSP